MSQRLIVLDTETTGLEVSRGHRVIEIGCIELIERRPTGRYLHHYLNPDREIDAGAAEVTGLTTEFLADKPRFSAVADEFLDFIREAELIIHNAEFDVGFLENELALCNASVTRLADCARITDTLAMARERYPGKRNSLDALCQRLEIDNGHRKLHGARLDAELLAEVYLAMTSGQGDLVLASSGGDARSYFGRDVCASIAASATLHRASAEEYERHARMLDRMERAGSTAIWRKYLSE